MKTAPALLVLASLSALTGCNSFDAPLIFGKVDTFGMVASATAPDQGASASLGYRSAKVAIVPVSARNGSGDVTVLTEQRAGPDNTGAFSTFAHFEASVAAGAGAQACLGDTFATGLAAQKIAEALPRVCR
jgi:hypothetical protein